MTYMIVPIYMAGNLSHEEDKIVAISRLATRFKGLLQDTEYLAGFWSGISNINYSGGRTLNR